MTLLESKLWREALKILGTPGRFKPQKAKDKENGCKNIVIKDNVKVYTIA